LLEQIYECSGHGLNSPVSPRDILDREKEFPNSTLDAERIVKKAMSLAATSSRQALDVGSGYGFYTKKLIECGYRTTSINPGRYENEVFREICGREPLSVYFQEFSTDTRFEIILMSQVLEHMKSPAQAVAKVSALLAKGGVFACAVPNFRSFSVMIRGTRDNGCLWVPEHVNYFTAAGLKKLVASCGLRVVRCDYITRIPYHKISRRLGLSGKGPLHNLLASGLDCFGRLADRLGYGICINLYAVKVE
jgi:SAM-dependent methyltransferase